MPDAKTLLAQKRVLIMIAQFAPRQHAELLMRMYISARADLKELFLKTSKGYRTKGFELYIARGCDVPNAPRKLAKAKWYLWTAIDSHDTSVVIREFATLGDAMNKIVQSYVWVAEGSDLGLYGIALDPSTCDPASYGVLADCGLLSRFVYNDVGVLISIWDVHEVTNVTPNRVEGKERSMRGSFICFDTDETKIVLIPDEQPCEATTEWLTDGTPSAYRSLEKPSATPILEVARTMDIESVIDEALASLDEVNMHLAFGKPMGESQQAELRTTLNNAVSLLKAIDEILKDVQL